MAYTDIISLSEAKNYLRVDDTLTEDDNSIIRMINAALRYVENYTDVLVFDRDVTYLVKEGVLQLYQYPINTDLETLADYTYERKSKYTNICASNTDTVDLVLNMGFTDPTDVPQELVEVAYEMIELYYGESKGIEKKKLSDLSIRALNSNKRFWI